MPVPPRAEQEQIVRFLDWKVSLTNKLIRTKIKEINLLRELKQVLINKELLAKSNRKRVPLKRYVKSNRESLSERTSENHRIEYLDIGSVGYGYIKTVSYTHLSTLSNDQHPSRQFDFMLSNPPYGKSWKTDAEKMGGKNNILDTRFNLSLIHISVFY